MLPSVTPYRLFGQQIRTLQSHLPGVLDGSAESVHDARVASRRVRELLPLVAERRQFVEDMGERFKAIGRALGRVRDADVRMELLSSLETRIPHAAPSILVVRQCHERERQDLMRRLIKRLERVDVKALLRDLANGGGAGWSSSGGLFRSAPWRGQLRRALVDRAHTASSAIAHATGVYFPNRVHSARIALKRLRYAVEIADETRFVDGGDALNELKKTQDVLGDLHDRHDLISELSSADASETAPHSEPIQLVVQVMDAECRELHGRYLARRDALLEICAKLGGLQAFNPIRSAPLMGLGVLALSSGYAIRRRQLAGRRD